MNWTNRDVVEVAQAQPGAALAFTANALIKQNGSLTMGAGAAKSVLVAYPGVDMLLGRTIVQQLGLKSTFAGVSTPYHLAVVDTPTCKIIAVQVLESPFSIKDNAYQERCFEITKISLEKLAQFIDEQTPLPVVMNCPLVGLGKFQGEDADCVYKLVESVLEDRPATVCLL